MVAAGVGTLVSNPIKEHECLLERSQNARTIIRRFDLVNAYLASPTTWRSCSRAINFRCPAGKSARTLGGSDRLFLAPAGRFGAREPVRAFSLKPTVRRRHRDPVRRKWSRSARGRPRRLASWLAPPPSK
jgi:hypothetical protein